MFSDDELNSIMRTENSFIYNLLSEKGKSIFFPKDGIISQSIAAKNKSINATIGSAINNDGSPMCLPSIAKNVLLNPKDVFPYASSYGKSELRQVWLTKIKEKNPSLKGKTTLPVVTNALTHGLSLIGYLFINANDQILLSDLYWGNYKLIFEHAFGADLKTFSTFKENGFDLDSLRKELSPETKILLLNFPNNPLGYVPTVAEAETIVKIIYDHAQKGNSLIVVCDDAYIGLNYCEGLMEESFFSRLADLHPNILTIKIDGATKEDYVWGLRIGFITYAYKNITEQTARVLEDKTAGVIRGGISNVSHLSQSIVLEGFRSSAYAAEKEEKYQILKKRFVKIQDVLKEKKYLNYFTPLPHNAGYFMCLKLKENLDPDKVRIRLLQDYDTGIISTGNLLRIAFSSVPEENIHQLFENIYHACCDEDTK